MDSKRLIAMVVLALMTFTGLQAQNFRVGVKVTDGAREWTVQEIRMDTYVYLTTSQFDELTLEKVKGESGSYKMIPSRQADDPVFGEEFGCPAVFMREDGNLILAFLDSKSNKVDALRPLVAREDYTFKAEFLPVQEQPSMCGRILVKGLAGSSFEPEFEVELELAHNYDTDDNRLVTLQWVNDKTDLNFDGIPDLLIYLGMTGGRGARNVEYGYVWNDDECCFESVWTERFTDLEVDPDTKTLTCTYSNGPVEDVVETFVWQDGKLRRAGDAGPADLRGLWYDGSLVYESQAVGDGMYRLNAMAEGEEHEFMLTPVPEENDTYRPSDGSGGTTNSYSNAAKVVYRAQDEHNVLCVYAADGSLSDVLSHVDNWDAQQLNIELWQAQICGKYKADNGSSVVLAEDHVVIDGRSFPLEVVTFNGTIIRIVEVGKAGSPMHAWFELTPTIDGMKAAEVVYDDDAYWFEPTGTEYKLVWNDKATSRFDFASDVLLNDQLNHYDKATLRLMRNAILARHGYVFQSKDLKDYFSNQTWYRPAAGNADITLSFIEQLNVDLIKSAEKAAK